MSFDGDAYQLASGPDAGAGEELLKGGLDRPLRDAKVLPDLLVTKAFKDAAQDSSFSCAQRLLGRLCAAAVCACDQRFYHARIDPGFAFHDAADGLCQLCKRTALEEDTGDTVVQSAQRHAVGHASGHYENGAGEAPSSTLIQK